MYKRQEEKGGFYKAVKEGFVQNQVNASAETRHMNVARRKEILLGTNQYPNFNEVASDKIVNGEACGCGCGKHEGGHHCEPEFPVLNNKRAASDFETLRLATERSGKRPTVFVLTIGNLAMRLARSDVYKRQRFFLFVGEGGIIVGSDKCSVFHRQVADLCLSPVCDISYRRRYYSYPVIVPLSLIHI